MSVSDNIGSFRTVSVLSGSSLYRMSIICDSGREREHCIGNNIISYGAFSDKNRYIGQRESSSKSYNSKTFETKQHYLISLNHTSPV